MSWPSKTRSVGMGTPASLLSVGNTSRLLTTWLEVLPAWIWPFQYANDADRIPPSQVDPLPTFQYPAACPFRMPVLPALLPCCIQGPLSPVKRIRVFSSMPASCKALWMLPTTQSVSARASPKGPRLERPRNLQPAYWYAPSLLLYAVCTWLKGTYKKKGSSLYSCMNSTAKELYFSPRDVRSKGCSRTEDSSPTCRTSGRKRAPGSLSAVLLSSLLM
mmetsp:Transcript_137890/g.428502  ORF Transcript_137890/g.428502 Transcript_137890/m.428502 type:complete len:218 (-) Transcript_137890:622-1275(-)